MVSTANYALGAVSIASSDYQSQAELTILSFSYIPVKVDYSDLYDILAFFIGGPDGRNGHDQLGRKIAKQGQEWAKYHWREVDMQCESPKDGDSTPCLRFGDPMLILIIFQHIYSVSSSSTPASLKEQRRIQRKRTTQVNDKLATNPHRHL